MPERQPTINSKLDLVDLEKKIIAGRLFTMQIEAKLLLFYQLMAFDTDSTIRVVANKKGEQYPVRKRFTGQPEIGADGSPKFYKWEVSMGQIRKGNIAIAIESPEGEPGLLRFWLHFLTQTKQAPAKVQEAPASK